MNTKRITNLNRWVPAAIVIICSILGSHASGQMVLTQSSINAGLTLTTFASNFPVSNSVGPLGILFQSNGGVMVTDYPGNLRIFPTDTDGQSANSVPAVQNFGNHDAVGLAQLGTTIYMTDQAGGNVDQLNANGTFNHVAFANLPDVTGIVADAKTGHLYVSQSSPNALVELNPSNGSAISFATPTFPDGVYLTPDDSTLYAVANGHILGYNTSTKAQFFDSGPVGSVDGLVLGSGPEAGDIIANTNSGQLIAINPTTDVETILATGGTRGDFVTIDPNNGSLLVTQTSTILRLTGATSVPEPASISILLGIAGLATRRPNRRRV